MLMTTSLADIVFECPRCRGPIMVERKYVGRSLECPHCFEGIEVPALNEVNKEKFVEPPGLRRILREVRDREWEHMRRKLRTFRAKIEHLEKLLQEATEAASAGEAESLRKQVAEMGERFVQANQAFTAGRKQHDLALEKLRRDLELAREEIQALQKKRETPEPVPVRSGAGKEWEEVVSQEIVALKSDLEWARGEVTELRQQLAAAQAETEAERAKVFLMEAATVSDGAPAYKGRNGAKGSAPAKNGATHAAPASESGEAESHLAELQKQNAGLRAARDRAQKDLEGARAQLTAREREDGRIEKTLSELESGIKEAARAVSSRRDCRA